MYTFIYKYIGTQSNPITNRVPSPVPPCLLLADYGRGITRVFIRIYLQF